MPDISMCRNRRCKLRIKCYRYRAIPDKHRQAYMAFQNPCADFWPIPAIRSMSEIEGKK